MNRFLVPALVVLTASAAAAEESEAIKHTAPVHRAATHQHAAARSAAPYKVHSAVGASGGTGTAVQQTAVTSGMSSPDGAPGAAVFHNGKGLSTGSREKGLGSTPRALRPTSRTTASTAASGVSPAAMSHGYGATAAAPPPSAGAGPAPIRMDGKGQSVAGQGGVTRGAADTPPSGGSSKDPLSSILDGLAGMFKNMANMLGGGG